MLIRKGILTLIVLCLVKCAALQPSSSRHLVVLVHGLMGSARDLEYLAQRLEERGSVVVLQSSANQYAQSLAGIKQAAQRLVEEIHEVCLKNPQLDRVSFVGNSLGGLFARYAIKLLSIPVEERSKGDPNAEFFLSTETGIDLGIKLYPEKFMTIASPYLGVLDHNYLQDLAQRYLNNDKLWFPDWMKHLVGKSLLRSGTELFMQDEYRKGGGSSLRNTLVYRMCTEEMWLWPLRNFKQRRLYANLDADFVVPLSTAAFLERHEVKALRNQHIYRSSQTKMEVIDEKLEGVELGADGGSEGKKRDKPVGRLVHEIVSTERADGTLEHRWTNLEQAQQTQANGASNEMAMSTTRTHTTVTNSCEATESDAYSPREDLYCFMRERLNSLGWEKYVVHFDGMLASNHNKLAAVRRNPQWFFDGVLGFHAGTPIMDHACDFLIKDEGQRDQPEKSR
jgi:hypothetical protein